MSRSNRRRFIGTTAVTGVGFFVAAGLHAQPSTSPNEKINFAAIGIGGKGSSDSEDAKKSGNMVAICDVDEQRLGGAAKKFEGAKPYTDFRKLLDEMGKSIDAVTVSTPDHTHTPASIMAMRMGKHCFCQKPLTRTIYEARLMGKVAREMKVATQMGNQGTAGESLRRGAAMMRGGALGTVKEVHVWTNRPVWPQGGDRPQPKDPPDWLKWDLWLANAPERPYAPGAYHSFNWRGWWDFGSGALGDMACHTVNMPYMGLQLANPTWVQAETSGHNKDSFPSWSIIEFSFPANDWRPAVKFFWYDGKKRPSAEVLEVMGDAKIPGSGCLIIGEKGSMFSGGDYGGISKLYGNVDESKIAEFKRSPGHFKEFVDAIRGEGTPMSNFPDYAGPLTETILLGNLAVYAASQPGKGPRVEWDAVNLKSPNMPDLEKIVKPTYRAPYKLEG